MEKILTLCGITLIECYHCNELVNEKYVDEFFAACPCGNAYGCTEHFTRCEACGTDFCNECIPDDCHVCGNPVCTKCKNIYHCATCESGSRAICGNCADEGKCFCDEYEAFICEESEKTAGLCQRCAEEN